MTSIKIKFRPSSATGKEGTIFYQLTHDSKVRQLQPGYRIHPYEGTPDAQCRLPEHPPTTSVSLTKISDAT